MSQEPHILTPADSELARRIRDHDWTLTPLGPLESWPQSLRVALGICLHSRFPMAIWWGPQLVNIYNDAYAAILGRRHPAALGQSAADIWAEAWPSIRPLTDAVLRRGESTWNERVRLVLDRNGAAEEAFFTWAYSPVFNDAGGVGGLLCIVTDETERVRMEIALAETRRRLDSALIAGEVGTFEWDVGADRLWGDSNFARLFAIELDDTGAAPLADYMAAIHPDDQPRVTELIRETLQTGRDFEAEYRIVSGGVTRFVIARGKGEQDESGRVARFPGVVIDVTDSRVAEEALQQSEAKYRTLFESLDEGFCVLEVLYEDFRPTDCRFIEVNPAFEKLTGLTNAQGRTARELSPNLEQHWFDIYGDVARTGEPIRFEGGSVTMGRWFDVFAFRVDRPEDRKVALLFKDISEQKQAEELLRQSRDQFRAVLENSLDASYRRDLRTDTYDYLGPSVEQVLGITQDDMHTLPVDGLLERIHPGDREHVRRAIEEGMRQHRGRVEYRIRLDDGSYRFIADHFTVQSDDNGVPVYRTGIVRDVSEQKHAEQALRDARDAAEAASLAKSQFLAVMSHELRTPLTGVIGFADLLETEVLGPVEDRQKEALSRIKAGSWHLIDVIDDILTLSRAEAGKEEIRITTADVAEITREVVRIVHPHAHGSMPVLVANGADDPVLVRTDAGKVRQILVNLMGNAVKYAPHSVVTVTLDQSLAGWLQVHVRDTGPGIAADDLERIFEPFTQVDSSLTRSGSGVGLGLAICRRMARLLGGDVTVVSEAGTGSTFTLRLPRD